MLVVYLTVVYGSVKFPWYQAVCTPGGESQGSTRELRSFSSRVGGEYGRRWWNIVFKNIIGVRLRHVLIPQGQMKVKFVGADTGDLHQLLFGFTLPLIVCIAIYTYVCGRRHWLFPRCACAVQIIALLQCQNVIPIDINRVTPREAICTCMSRSSINPLWVDVCLTVYYFHLVVTTLIFHGSWWWRGSLFTTWPLWPPHNNHSD